MKSQCVSVLDVADVVFRLLSASNTTLREVSGTLRCQRRRVSVRRKPERSSLALVLTADDRPAGRRMTSPRPGARISGRAHVVTRRRGDCGEADSSPRPLGTRRTRFRPRASLSGSSCRAMTRLHAVDNRNLPSCVGPSSPSARRRSPASATVLIGFRSTSTTPDMPLPGRSIFHACAD